MIRLMYWPKIYISIQYALNGLLNALEKKKVLTSNGIKRKRAKHNTRSDGKESKVNDQVLQILEIRNVENRRHTYTHNQKEKKVLISRILCEKNGWMSAKITCGRNIMTLLKCSFQFCFIQFNSMCQNDRQVLHQSI